MTGVQTCALPISGHDYKGQRVSCIAQERETNPRLANTSRETFLDTMANLKLPPPRRIDVALPANEACGRTQELIDLHGV